MRLLHALGAAIVVGLVVFLIGAILSALTAVAWVVSIGGILKDVSGLCALITFIYVLVVGFPTRPNGLV